MSSPKCVKTEFSDQTKCKKVELKKFSLKNDVIHHTLKVICYTDFNIHLQILGRFSEKLPLSAIWALEVFLYKNCEIVLVFLAISVLSAIYGNIWQAISPHLVK